MRLWLQSYTRTSPMSEWVVISIVAHAAIIAGATVATSRPAALPEGSLANRSYYIPPPNRIRGQQGARETLKYVEIAPDGDASGLGAPLITPTQSSIDAPPSLGDLGLDSISLPGAPVVASVDTAFSLLEVDSAVTRDPSSIAPAYPLILLRGGVQGRVATQYVVDTAGRADPKSIKILFTTHEEFATSVRAALPYMRFVPARLGGRKVRQLVEQEFTFKIQQPAANPDTIKKPIP